VDISTRRQRLLKHVVEEYVGTAVPVASETVARKYEPDISSATIRNELAALEEQGLIGHPHTSAGRVPTDRGYRFYVEHLMGALDLAPNERRTIAHQFHQVESDVDEWVRLASSVLANALHSAAVVTLPVSSYARLRRLELVPLGERLILLALLLASGALRKHLIHSEEPVDRDELVRLSNRVTATLPGAGALRVHRETARARGLEQQVLEATERILRVADEQALQQVYFEGLSHMLAQPEFASSQKALPIVEALEHGYVLARLLSHADADDEVRVVIGQENPLEQMRETSAVMIRYALTDDVTGVLGVLGPTRLPYWRAVPLVRYLAGLLRLMTSETRV
jgi:heat-inducible transcriptional repressor